jgi:NADPH:quinone reductase-like Zn-dependent oxidoreductase
MGAEVTAVCSPRNLEQARALGADLVIDYTREDFTRSGLQYDLILAVNGYHTLADYRRALAPRGVFVMAGGSPRQIFEALILGSWMSKKDGPKMKALTAKLSHEDLVYLKGLLESGQLKPVIDRVYPLSQAADAMRYLGSGHARGKIVITMQE